MSGDLRGVLAKLDHAQRHSNRVDRVLGEWLERDPYRFTLHPDGDWWRLRWQVLEPIPEEIALTFADMLANLRSALDLLAWQLVLLSGSQPTQRTAWPVVRHARDWGSAVGDRLRGVDPDIVASIEQWQPYCGLGGPTRHPLAVLDDVNNLNKHRVLPVTVTTIVEMRPLLSGDIGGREIFFEVRPHAPIEDDVEFLRISITPPLAELDVHFEENATVGVAMGEGIVDGPVPDLVEFVRLVVSTFEPAFSRQG